MMINGYNVSFSINGKPISYDDLSSLQLHNDTMQQIYDTVNRRITRIHKEAKTNER
jgi:hypothetical protein